VQPLARLPEDLPASPVFSTLPLRLIYGGRKAHSGKRKPIKNNKSQFLVYRFTWKQEVEEEMKGYGNLRNEMKQERKV
jgi:hypothetical protein